MTAAPEQAVAARRIDKVTFDYSVSEDRLLARIEAMNGDRGAVWITQRLARRLVAVLFTHLDKRVAAVRPGAERAVQRPSAPADPAQQQLQSFQHQAAVMRHASPAPVPAVDSSGAPVLQTIRAHLSRSRIWLTFDMPAGPGALGLTQDNAWQLLQILLNAFRRADWPLDAWPQWMRDGEAAASHRHDGKTPPLH